MGLIMKKKPILRITSNKGKTKQVFVSHTKKDIEFCDVFDRACARVGIKAFRSEFETITKPSWETIKEAMNQSVAVFFLVGKELVNNQDLRNHEWQYTQNWIGDDVLINFPMPYINNYLTVSLKHKSAFDYLRGILQEYKNGWTFPYPYEDFDIICPFNDCKMEFNFHEKLGPGGKIRCPQCLRDMEIV